MRNGRNVLLELLNLYVRIKIRVAKFDTNNSVTDSTQKINPCVNPEASWFCSQVSQRILPLTQSMCQVKRSGYRSVRG